MVFIQTEIFTACEVLKPEVIWSTSYNWWPYVIGGIFTEGDRYWLTKDQYTGHGFTIKLGTCKMSIVGIHVKNVAHHNTRSARSFHISGVLKESGPMGPWEQLLEEEFENPFTEGAPAPTPQTFYFKEAVEVQYLRFDLDTYWGNWGGGLDYFSVITVSGNLFVLF